VKNRYELVVFDWDGTLFDSVGWIVESIQQAARACGVAVPEAGAAREVIGLSLQEAMAALFPGIEGDPADDLMREYRRVYQSRAFGVQDLFPDVLEMLSRLRGCGFRLAVATGKTREGLRAALRATGTEPLFDAVRSADETASKPDPKMLFEIMRQVGVAPECTLMVGDSVHDLRMAKNAGVDAVGVTCGAHRGHRLAALDPVLCLERAADLLPHLV
jgi:phosphoglycolate phosphatase